MEAITIRMGETTVVIEFRRSRVRTVAVFNKYQPAQFVRIGGNGIDTRSSRRTKPVVDSKEGTHEEGGGNV